MSLFKYNIGDKVEATQSYIKSQEGLYKENVFEIKSRYESTKGWRCYEAEAISVYGYPIGTFIIESHISKKIEHEPI